MVDFNRVMEDTDEIEAAKVRLKEKQDAQAKEFIQTTQMIDECLRRDTINDKERHFLNCMRRQHYAYRPLSEGQMKFLLSIYNFKQQQNPS